MATPGRRGGAPPSVRVRVPVVDATVDDDMTEREDDEQTDHSSTGMASDSPRNQPAAPGIASPPTQQAHSPPLYGSGHHSPADSLFAEDDDYRSETSSSETNSKEYAGGAPHPPKHVSASFTNHRDLSSRLKRSIHSDNSAGPCFDESMVGADVVLCARRSLEEESGHQDEDDDAATEIAAPSREQEVQRFYTHRFMLAASSEPFRAMLTGRMRESAQREVEIHGVDARILEKMLVYIYTGEVTVDLQNVIGLLIGAEMYALAGLREICKGFVLIHAQDIFRDPQVVQMPEKVLIEVVENDDLQIKEISLMEALVMWGEARVATSDRPILEILSDVMEHVRFPTMSVSDLYSKVRPLVQDGVIRETLLTEALFYHLKWGTHASKASHRMRPRAGATALRKRKRVSFIQHVSFVNEE